MAKRRAIWPDLLTDKRRRKTSMVAMCLYYDLLMCVDDNGIYPFDLDKIILEVIPYFRGNDDEVEKFLLELIENKFIETYTPNGHHEQFLIILDWHQQGVLSNEYNKYPNKDGIVQEGKKRLGGKQRIGVIRTLAAENNNICSSCNYQFDPATDQKLTDYFTIIERVNSKTRGSKYAENYTLVCKKCSTKQQKIIGETRVTQCVTSGDTAETYIGIRDKGLGIRDKGLGINNINKKNINKKNIGLTTDIAVQEKNNFPFLKKISKKYHSDIIEVLKYWSKTMGVKIDLEKGLKTNEKRARCIESMLGDGYALEDCLNAVRGCLRSSHHMGQNDRQTKYNEIHNIFNPKNGIFEKFIRSSTEEDFSKIDGNRTELTQSEIDAFRELGLDHYLNSDAIDITPQKGFIE